MTRSKRIFDRWALSAEGAIIRDTEFKSYIDMMCALGAISLGYRETQYYGTGVTSFPSRAEVFAAEAVLQHVAPWASHVRFTKTGSEATHAAYRIAKAATGREIVVRFPRSYHGWHEWCANPHDGLTGLLEDFSKIAAIFVEPERFEPMNVSWLRALRKICDEWGILLIFDEMLWGGRWALGGCTEYHGVTPDLACWGKAFGNGQSVAFVTGRDALAIHGEMVSGTFSGDAMGLYAVCDTLKAYTSVPVIKTLWERGRYLYTTFSAAVPSSFATLSAPAPLMQIRYVNSEHKQRFTEGMLQRGVVVYPDWLMVMFAHTEQQIDRVCEAAAEAVKEIGNA